VTETIPQAMSDGGEVVVHRWLPSGGADGIVLIAHGASEHAGRYGRLAADLTDAGWVVYAGDHRGHGRTAGTLERFGIAGPDGWTRIVDDVEELAEQAVEAHPGAPLVLLGHSMGSFIIQDVLRRWGAHLSQRGLRAAVLTGTAGSLSAGAEGLRDRVEAAAEAEGRDVPSADFAMLFADFNDPFVDTAPASGPTGFEWLSRDPDEVQRYVDDPWCGQPLSNGFVADMAAALEETWAPGAERLFPRDVPLLIMAGALDPVGADGESVRELARRYRAAGLDVTEVIYDDARHEVFNETNRAEVHRDLIAWLEGVRGPGARGKDVVS
jgi:alpha-beta hydrolase superfamily lysophospholipase